MIEAALALVPFENIHPFPKGGGRIGRQLIVPPVVVDGVLREPMPHPGLRARVNAVVRCTPAGTT